MFLAIRFSSRAALIVLEANVQALELKAVHTVLLMKQYATLLKISLGLTAQMLLMKIYEQNGEA